MSLNLDSLQSTHGLDTAITDGAVFTLSGNDEYRFLIKVPSQHNKAFRNAVASAMDMSYDDDGNVKMTSNIVEFKSIQTDAFVKHCLVSINDEPVPDDFAERFPTVIDELLELSSEAANKIDAEVEEAVKK